MLNVHLSCKPTISWKILFRSGERPRLFSNMKKFRDLEVTGGGFRKGIIIQGMQLNRSFFCGRSVIPEKKRRCNGIVFTCTHTEE